MKRNFKEWLKTMKDNIASWDYYTDFDKVYKNVESIKVELNILNSLVGSKKIENEFRKLANEYPKILNAVPILIAKREQEIKVIDGSKEFNFNFSKQNYTIDEYVRFMDKTGLFDLLENHIISNLVDYVTGVEVGMDTNGRKNRTGHTMEDIIEQYLIDAGMVKDVSYFKEMYKSEVEKKFNIDLSKLSNDGKTEKRFDFVVYKNNHVYVCEVNYYSGGGSKLNETARSYKTLALETNEIQKDINEYNEKVLKTSPNNIKNDLSFVWFTDGIGWNSAKNNLEETYDVLDTIYNLNDLENGVLDNLFK